MADQEAPAAVTGSTTTVKTMADGTLRVSVDVEPRHAQAAFKMFGAPGTPVAIARLTKDAALAQTRRDDAPAVDYGKHYERLYKIGWFHNPAVLRAFAVNAALPPDKRIQLIKQRIYDETSSESLKEIEPHFFVQLCDALGCGATVPAEIRAAA